MTTVRREATAVDALVEGYLDDYLALDPVMATFIGVTDHDDDLPDLSPDGHAARSAVRRSTLAALDAADPVDVVDRVTVAAARDQLETTERLRAIGADESELNNIDCPVQNLRMAFDLMPNGSADDWSVIAHRLSRLPDALRGYAASLRAAAARGDVAPARQVQACIEQSRKNTGSTGFIATFVRDARAGTDDLPASVRTDLDREAGKAARAYDELADVLASELLAQAPERDAVGRERYALASRSFLGSSVDLEEAYAWGQDEVDRISTLMGQTAERIAAGTTPREAMTVLDADPSRMVVGVDALRGWMQETSDAAVAALADTYFDIPEPIRTLECRIAPTSTGGIYYTGPSEDFSRPGRMWWAVPDGITEFATWRETTTVYHEGVPGHHLQVGQTVYRRELLNRWRRLASWVSGHGEGWALYAEQLMADLGFLDDPGDLMGMLDGQSLRAARVVIDIGVHCEFPAPASVGGGDWDYPKAWQYLTAHAALSEPLLRYELDRYLGWPGQAPSYKIGERMWLELRDEARRRDAAFDITAFHRRALDVGSVGLDVLRGAVLGEYDEA